MMCNLPDRAEILRQFVVAVCCLIASVALVGHAQQPGPAVQSPVESNQKPSAETSKEPSLSSRQLREAEDAYLAGARLLDHGDMAKAEARFAKAAALNPANADYIQAAALAHEHRVSELVLQAGKARLSGHSTKADDLLAEARKLDPENRIVTQHTDAALLSSGFRPEIQAQDDPPNGWRQESAAISGPITLLPDPGKQSFQISADSQQTIRQVLSRYGIRALFDESVQAKSVRFNLEDVTYDRASTILFQMTNTFAVPLDPHSVVIATDTTENRQRLERQLQETIYVPGFSTEQMTELGNVVRTVFDIKQATVQSGSGSLALRAPEDTLTAVNLTLADLIDGGAEVVLDLRLYTVDLTRQRNIGVQLPQQIGVYNVESEATNLVQANQSLVQQAISQGLIPANASNITIALALISSGLVQSTLLSNTIGFFGGGLTATGITTNTSTTLNLALNSSDTRALDNVQLRVSDRQSGTFRSGTRYPITTSTYTSGISGSAASLAGTTINGVSATSLLNQFGSSSGSVTIPQIQYEDLGLTLKATPSVQRSGLVRLKLDLKIEALAGSSINNIPILANRQYTSDVTVGDGETTLIASSLSRSESAAVSGIPGLSELPGFQTASSTNATETDSSELILLITPHIVRHRSNEIAGPRIAFNQRLPN
jgi:type II secretory pathway component GspD/PulD (secretin)